MDSRYEVTAVRACARIHVRASLPVAREAVIVRMMIGGFPPSYRNIQKIPLALQVRTSWEVAECRNVYQIDLPNRIEGNRRKLEFFGYFREFVLALRSRSDANAEKCHLAYPIDLQFSLYREFGEYSNAKCGESKCRRN